MNCPVCGDNDTRVLDSRPSSDGTAIRRRRECAHCSFRFTTYERVENIPLVVVKRDGRREPFDRQKILSGLLRACHKRPVSASALEEVANHVERDIMECGEREIASVRIGEYVVDRLRTLDEVAYVRFASVYREFKDIDSFLQELRTMLDESNP